MSRKRPRGFDVLDQFIPKRPKLILEGGDIIGAPVHNIGGALPMQFAGTPRNRYDVKAYYRNFSLDTGNAVLLNNIAQGTDINQRIGRQLITHAMMIRCAPSLTQQRFIIFYDKQWRNGLPNPTSADLMDSNSIVSDYQFDKLSRFDIIYDKTFDLQIATQIGIIYTPGVHVLIPLDTRTTFQGVGANDIEFGAFFALRIGSGTASSFMVKFFYTDL